MNLSYDTAVNTTYALTGIAAIISIVLYLLMGIAVIIVIASLFMIYKKASKQSVAAIIPIWRELVLCSIAEKEWWYIFLLLIPVYNIYVLYVLFKEVANKFGKSNGFAVGMIIIPYVFLPILALKCDYMNNNVIEVVEEEPINEDYIKEIDEIEPIIPFNNEDNDNEVLDAE